MRVGDGYDCWSRGIGLSILEVDWPGSSKLFEPRRMTLFAVVWPLVIVCCHSPPQANKMPESIQDIQCKSGSPLQLEHRG